MQSLAHQFLTFCRSKPADERYDYTKAKTCALTQFGEFAGIGHLVDAHPSNMPPVLYEAVNPGTGDQETAWTFGALADRLEAALTKAS